jgi:Zn-dependent protease
LNGSLTIGRLAGAKVNIDGTFLVLVLLYANSAFRSGGWPAVADSLIFLLGLFASVFLHELGHLLAARRFGIRTTAITLVLFGGFASFAKAPQKTGEEIAIAIAGPLVNAAIAAGLRLWLQSAAWDSELSIPEIRAYLILDRLATANLYLAAFNIVPAFPLDGGRIFRALLSLRLGRRRAAVIASRVGQVFGVAVAVYGLVTVDVMLIVVGAYILVAAAPRKAAPTPRRAPGILFEDDLPEAKKPAPPPGDANPDGRGRPRSD